MNEPNEFEITVPEGVLPEDDAPAPEAPAPEVPGSATYTLPEGYITAEAPPPEEPPPEELPIVRHDPFAYMRGAPSASQTSGHAPMTTSRTDWSECPAEPCYGR